MSLDFAIRTWSSSSSGRVALFSLSDTAPTITVNGTDYTVGSGLTATSVGTTGNGVTDSFSTRPVAVYQWLTDAISLSSNSVYQCNAEQDNNTRTFELRTQLSTTDTDKFTLFFVSCDGYQSGSSDIGCWDYISTTAQNNNVKGIVHIDDHGYTDNLTVPNSETIYAIVSGSGRALNNDEDYSFAVCYASYLGLVDNNPVGSRFSNLDGRVWSMTNLPFFCGVGDHEMVDNFGFEDNTISATQISNARRIFLNTIGAAQVDSYVGDTTGHLATRNNIGPVELLTVDRCFGLNAGEKIWATSNPGDPDPAQDNTKLGYRILGSTQITELLASVDSTSQFKIVSLPLGSRFLMTKAQRVAAFSEAFPWKTPYLGAQQPLHEYTETGGVETGGDSEWLELYQLISSGSLSTKETDSYNPVIVTIHGDTHRPDVRYHYWPASLTKAKLSMYEISTGSVNGAPMQGLHTSLIQYYQNNGQTLNWLPDFTSRRRVDSDPASYESTCVQVDFEYVNDKWKMEVKIIHNNEQIHSVIMYSDKDNAPSYLRNMTFSA